MKGSSVISLSWRAVVAYAFVVFIRKLRRLPGEPLACKVMRETLEATYKVNDWMADRGISTSAAIPTMPFSLIQECGDASFKMPFPFKFVFDENPPSQEVIVKQFLENNKTAVYTRPMPPSEMMENMTPFANTYQGRFLPEKLSMQEAWPDIRDGKRRMYFDNTWTEEDYLSIMSEDAYNTLMGYSTFFTGTSFMSSYDKYHLSAPAHATVVKSVATQVLNRKDWIFIDPKIHKKYLSPEQVSFTTTGNIPITQDHDEILKHVPHYTVSTNAGEGLYFPEYWIHIVYTEKGLNIMTNWRVRSHFMDAFNSQHPLSIQIKMCIATSLFNYVIPEKLANYVKAYGQDLLQKSNEANGWMRKAIDAAN
eukprot:CAMPEP_0196828186 /NCGR_PEP_ID=MMETSP1362-20130617/94548_1 /TAXON_ID=163516 /ORGANISM="Leptocylindrus danicus, Strain CCMP1856" /LENGTH=364 /DNA_ID=CAMNT_0042208855 /DNA_START=496 /DNA_END=1590 /DNA_ORIENTATION=+